MPLLHGPSDPTTWNKKSVVFVHGIGQHDPGYSEPLYVSLSAADSTTVSRTRWYEFDYDRVSPTLAKKVTEFQEALPLAGRETGIWPKIADMIVGLGQSLFTVEFHDWIDNKFRAELMTVARDGLKMGADQSDHDIYFIAHSLGTVVGYEILSAIVGDKDILGVRQGFRVKKLFTLGSPLAFIRQNKNLFRNPKNSFHLLSSPIARPWHQDPFTGSKVTNVLNWHNIRHKRDPVASLIPLDKTNSNNAIDSEFVFDELMGGNNPHDFRNYVQAHAEYFLERIRL